MTFKRLAQDIIQPVEDLKNAATDVIIDQEAMFSSAREACTSAEGIVGQASKGIRFSLSAVDEYCQALYKALHRAKRAEITANEYSNIAMEVIHASSSVKMDRIKRMCDDVQFRAKGTKAIICPFCDSGFDNVRILSDHLIRKHPQQVATRVSIMFRYIYIYI